jgi:hypothetical protein
VHRANGGVSDGRILPVEATRVGLDPGIVQRSIERQVRGGSDAACGIGDDERQAQRSHLLSQPQ